ncbi:MAG TPA: transcriptional regulator [Nitrospirae bacterium]|nr:transcriptional regulator [Nitrospirota bacterium]
MRKKPKKTPVPAERYETVRQEMITVLKGQTLSAKGISSMVRASEKEVYAHLEHIQKTLKKEHDLIITPAECRKCGFTFKKRDRLKKPGKCPACREESIQEPLFSIKN